MPNLTIIAHITAKPGKTEFVKAEAEKLIEPTRAEEGCLHYTLHQDNNNPAHLMFYETWRSHEHLQTHMDSPHLQGYIAATKDALEGITLHEMTQIA